MQKIYRSKSFENKIQMNLADVSAKPGDKFILVNAYYDPKTFDCDLCGHKNCMYAYEIKNLETDKIMKVGSECVHHFANKGVDIDLAEALMKRVMSATNKARKDLKHKLGIQAWEALTEEQQKEIPFYKKYTWIEEAGKIAYKTLSKHEKRDLIVKEFTILQAKELLIQVRYGKHYLTEEEITHIATLGLEKEMDTAQEISKNYK